MIGEPLPKRGNKQGALRSQFEGVSEGRRNNMRANRSKDTKAELVVRKLLHSLGYRFRLHQPDLPGKPDIVFTRRNKIVEVRGCFWHGHLCYPLGQPPKQRVEYWAPKLARTRERDAANALKLKRMGWQLLVVWECETRNDLDRLQKSLTAFLGPAGPASHSG